MNLAYRIYSSLLDFLLVASQQRKLQFLSFSFFCVDLSQGIVPIYLMLILFFLNFLSRNVHDKH